MSITLRQLTCHLALFTAVLLMLVQYSATLPTAFHKRLFDEPSDIVSQPEFARPDEGDLQRNSARLHRTLFLLDTSDLLKNARLFGEKSTKSKETSRSKRQTALHGSLIGKVPLVIRAKKPTMTFHDNLDLSSFE